MGKRDVDIDFDNGIKWFALGMLYQVFLIVFQVFICILFVIGLFFQTPFFNLSVPILCGVSILITVIDLIISLHETFSTRIYALLLIDIWFFIRYTILPLIILILSSIF